MTFVVTENCIKCKYMDCVEVCPVDCFHEGPNFLVIDPDECIDCTLCEPECPAKAIYPEDDVPAGQEGFIALNAELAKAWPVITTRGEPLPCRRLGWQAGQAFRAAALIHPKPGVVGAASAATRPEQTQRTHFPGRVRIDATFESPGARHGRDLVVREFR